MMIRRRIEAAWAWFNTTTVFAAAALALAWVPSLAIIFYGVLYGSEFYVDGSTRLTMMVPVVLSALAFESIRLQARITARVIATLYLVIVLLASITLVGLIWAPSAFMMFVAAMSLEE